MEYCHDVSPPAAAGTAIAVDVSTCYQPASLKLRCEPIYEHASLAWNLQPGIGAVASMTYILICCMLYWLTFKQVFRFLSACVRDLERGQQRCLVLYICCTLFCGTLALALSSCQHSECGATCVVGLPRV